MANRSTRTALANDSVFRSITRACYAGLDSVRLRAASGPGIRDEVDDGLPVLAVIPKRA